MKRKTCPERRIEVFSGYVLGFKGTPIALIDNFALRYSVTVRLEKVNFNSVNTSNFSLAEFAEAK